MLLTGLVPLIRCNIEIEKEREIEKYSDIQDDIDRV